MLLETVRLKIRELEATSDAPFINELLNTPKFLKYIGDRRVRSDSDAANFIENNYRQSYRDYGYGLYAVLLRESDMPIGMCGFVKRPHFSHPDIGFAFLPDYEQKGYGFESASAMMRYGLETLGFENVLAITTPDNEASGRLLEKIGLHFDHIEIIGCEELRVYSLFRVT